MGHIFISYSRKDQEIVDRIVEAMKQAGLNVWIDQQNIQAGQLWRSQIVEAVDTSDAAVLLLSPSSSASDKFRREVDLVEGANKMLVPVLLAPVTLPAKLRYQLAGLQLIDLQNLGFEKAVNQLIEVLRDRAKASEEPSVRQVELVIEGVDLSKFGANERQQLLDLISELVKTPQSQFQNVMLTAGHAVVAMPASAAFELKTRALNRDHRFEQFGIKALKLSGDKNYVDISPETGGSVTIGRRPPGDPTTDAPPPKPKPK